MKTLQVFVLVLKLSKPLICLFGLWCLMLLSQVQKILYINYGFNDLISKQIIFNYLTQLSRFHT
jgi:hypothetical protein